MVAHGTPCLGPVTHTGCGALCPSYDRGCYGCFGPMETPNTAGLDPALRACGMAPRDVARVYGTFNVGLEPFRTRHLEPTPAETPALTHTRRQLGDG
jgi:hypothetical protein